MATSNDNRAFFRGKRIAVIGAARTGVALARALVPQGAAVHVFDRRPEAENAEATAALRQIGAETTWGDDVAGVADADIVVTSPGVPTDGPLLSAVRKRGQTLWGEIEVAYRLSKAPIAAITGTNGKTTTTALLGALLQDAGLDARVGGNIAPGVPLTELAAEAPATAILVAEISSFQLETIEAFRPKVGILTNVTPDHLDRYHGSMEAYAAAKARLFENQTPDDHAVVNADNEVALEIGEASHGTLWTWSRTGPVDRGAYVRCGQMVLRDDDGETVIGHAGDIRLTGAHNLENALGAIIAAKIFGAPADNMMHTLTHFAGVEHRMEAVATVEGVEYVNNSMCTNPAALLASIEAYRRPLVLITGGRNKGLAFTGLEDAFAKHCQAVITIGEHGGEFARMARAANVPVVQEAGTLDVAVEAARSAARPGDVVLLAPGCASMDQFHDFQDRGDQFKRFVRQFTT